MLELFNLHKGEEDKEKTLTSVKSNIAFTGSNLWILSGAIIVASVGLNVNSTAVIIGAMLISPLMGPIVGAGFALGIYDFDILKKSLINLLIATLVGLFVSSIYFYLSPFKEVQSELLSRTSPNIFDVIIAFFGGLVGVITITRVEKGNPIPGVAIATALMPPLCTAGFGLATGNFKFFFGALFLYSINCVFICISTYSIVKLLKYPAKIEVDTLHQKRVKYGVTIIIFLVLLPSTYFAISLYKQQQFKQRVESFIEKEFIEKGNTIVYKKTDYSSNSSKIELAFLNKTFSDNDLNVLNQELKKYGIENTKLSIRENSFDNINEFKNDILNEVSKTGIILDEKDHKIEELTKAIAQDHFDDKQIFEEMKIIFPSIKTISIGHHNKTTNDKTIPITVFIYQAKPNLGMAEKIKLNNWLQKRLSTKKLEIIKQ